MPLDYNKCLLISCGAIHYFTNRPLLTKDAAGNTVPAPGAEAVRIDKILNDVHTDDMQLGLHGIDFILDNLYTGCKNEQYNLAMGTNELLDATLIKTIKHLAKWIRANADPLV